MSKESAVDKCCIGQGREQENNAGKEFPKSQGV